MRRSKPARRSHDMRVEIASLCMLRAVWFTVKEWIMREGWPETGDDQPRRSGGSGPSLARAGWQVWPCPSRRAARDARIRKSRNARPRLSRR